ncbi:MAG: molybdopterin biosynthesis protein [Planctomycetota bacterium]
MDQEQFLHVVPLAEARRRLADAAPPHPLPAELVPLAAAWGRVLAEDVAAPHDVPGFDRSNVDGWAVQAADTFGASEREPARLRAVGAPLEPGIAADQPVAPGTARAIATGACVPRGADAIVMVEHTRVVGDIVHIERPAVPGERIAAAGTDMARGERVLFGGRVLTARDTAVLAACGLAEVPCVRRPRVAIVSSGNEIVAPGTPLAAGQVHDTNARALADAVREVGGEPIELGIVRDDLAASTAKLDEALALSDLVLWSGGTSKGPGDVAYRAVAARGRVLVHGVALKPGKPLCLAVIDGTPVAVLPGFPTSALFTFHAVIDPWLRRRLGLPEAPTSTLEATWPRTHLSESGRTEYELVRLVPGRDGWLAVSLGKGSGSVTTFATADGFVEIPASQERVDAGDRVRVVRWAREAVTPDLVIAGSHCVGLDLLVGRWRQRRLPAHTAHVQVLALGSRGGLDAVVRGACHVAPIHLLDETSGRWNEPFLPARTRLVHGYGRRQGLLLRRDDAARFADRDVEEAILELAADATMRVAARNPGSGTRLLMDALLARGRKEPLLPAGWTTAYKSHTAVAVAIAQGRADWGIGLEQAASAEGLAWRPWVDEQYDFVVPDEAFDLPAVQDFLAVLADPTTSDALAQAGFRP